MHILTLWRAKFVPILTAADRTRTLTTGQRCEAVREELDRAGLTIVPTRFLTELERSVQTLRECNKAMAHELDTILRSLGHD